MFVSMEQVKMTRRLMKRGRCEFPDIYDRQEILSRWFQEEEFECARTPAVKLLGDLGMIQQRQPTILGRL